MIRHLLLVSIPMATVAGADHADVFPVRMAGRGHGYPYQIPYRSLLPKPEECENLIVPVALSCTHVGISSIRVEPTWMILGQSAGIAAAMSAEKDLPVQQLPYPELRERLRDLPLPGSEERPLRGADGLLRPRNPRGQSSRLDPERRSEHGS